MNLETLQERNYWVEKHNLVLVCRFVIKSVLDKSSVGEISEENPEVINLLATLEHILKHKAKSGRTFFSDNDAVTFWPVVKDALFKTNFSSSVENVISLTHFKSGTAKGRAWLRIALMEKMLSEYLGHVVKQTQVLSKYYNEGAVMLSDDINLLIEDLVGLSTVDFSFCLKGKNVTFDGRILVDYSPYLKFHLCEEGIENDMQEVSEAEGASVSQAAVDDNQAASTYELRDRLASLQKAYRTTNEQKGYLEQMLKKSEQAYAQRQADFDDMVLQNHAKTQNYEKDLRKYEAVILDLQKELSALKVNNKELQRTIKSLYTGAERAAVMNYKLETSSTVSENLSLEDLTLREDNSSLKPLYGSLMSETGSLTSVISESSERPRSIEMSTPSLAPSVLYRKTLRSQSHTGATKPSSYGSFVNDETTSHSELLDSFSVSEAETDADNTDRFGLRRSYEQLPSNQSALVAAIYSEQ